MPTVNKDGSITYSMEEFSQMQQSGNQPKGQEGSQEQSSWIDKWKEKMSPKKPTQQQQQQQQQPGLIQRMLGRG